MLLGIVLLLFGRRAFWIFVAAVGFVAGLTLATEFMHGQPELVILLIAVVGGIVGAVLAIVLEWLAILIGGFLAGGSLAIAFATSLSLTQSVDFMVIYLIGGIIGLLLVAALFDWAIILLSVLLGAGIIMAFLNVNLTEVAYWLVYLGLVVIGVMVQVGFWHRRYPVQRTWRRRETPQSV